MENASPCPRHQANDAVPIIETRGLTKEFAGFHAVKDVNLKVRRNTIHALIGPNGAGKTTVFNLLTKFLTPTSGQIFYNGKDITNISPADVALIGMVRSFQISSIFEGLTTLENVRVALQRDLGTSFHFWRPKHSLYGLNERAMQLIESVDLTDYLNAPAATLPYGRKRALELATTLALDPQMLLLDEPMAGLGQEDIARITSLIRKISKDRSILMVEHNLSVVASLSDQITVLTRGSILAEGSYEIVSKHPAVQAAYIGSEDIDD